MGAPEPPPPMRCYSPGEVAAHSSPDDAWVSFHGNVYDLTTLIAKNEGPLVQPLVKVAGTDISHWFTAAWTKADHDTVTGRELSKKDISIKMHIDPVTNLRRPYVPMEHLMEVPSEETIGEIRERYLEYNWHAGSYTWKILRKDEEGGEMSFAELELNKTLADNGVEDETEEFQELGIPSDYFIPVIHLYYTDDLTVA